MKYSVTFLIALACTLAACQNTGKQEQQAIVIKESNMCTKTLLVDGMACVGCEVTIEEKLSKIEGVVSAKASHQTKQVKVAFDSTKTDLKTIKSNIVESGYTILIE